MNLKNKLRFSILQPYIDLNKFSGFEFDSNSGNTYIIYNNHSNSDVEIKEESWIYALYIGKKNNLYYFGIPSVFFESTIFYMTTAKTFENDLISGCDNTCLNNYDVQLIYSFEKDKDTFLIKKHELIHFDLYYKFSGLKNNE